MSYPDPLYTHFHRTMAESFYLLSGTVRIYDGEEWVDAGVGDFAHVPPGGIHGFTNESGAPASMLIHFAPRTPPRGVLRRSQPSERDVTGGAGRILPGSRQQLPRLIG